VQNLKTNHPWRRGRSASFASYLESLPPLERTHIEAAERRYVVESDSYYSRRARAERDFSDGMAGVREGYPAAHRGFVS
jgi:hypothetical protein